MHLFNARIIHLDQDLFWGHNGAPVRRHRQTLLRCNEAEGGIIMSLFLYPDPATSEPSAAGTADLD